MKTKLKKFYEEIKNYLIRNDFRCLWWSQECYLTIMTTATTEIF